MAQGGGVSAEDDGSDGAAGRLGDGERGEFSRSLRAGDDGDGGDPDSLNSTVVVIRADLRPSKKCSRTCL